MGNRAIITGKDFEYGIYVHWNGGRDSVEAFLKYAQLKGTCEFTTATAHYDGGLSRLIPLVTVLANWFGNNGHTVDIVKVPNPLPRDYDSACDNGVYIVEGWTIVDRIDMHHAEQNEHALLDMLHSIDQAQPERDRLGKYIDGHTVPVETVKVGDTIFIPNGYKTSGMTAHTTATVTEIIRFDTLPNAQPFLKVTVDGSDSTRVIRHVQQVRIPA